MNNKIDMNTLQKIKKKDGAGATNTPYYLMESNTRI